ncbi:MAG TPA: hypothetical protein VD867_12865 [Burkholderiales bacterium]|nr:hypothetical protein [Burkholderiales bacterium]
MRPILFLLCVLLAPAAHAAPWLCTGPNGSKAFSYEPEAATRKNCVHQPIPSANVWRETPRDSAGQRPEGFPRVEAKIQKQRDLARREILARELAEEKKALAEAMRALEEQQLAMATARREAGAQEKLRPYRERVRLHHTNISNLEKELARAG